MITFGGPLEVIGFLRVVISVEESHHILRMGRVLLLLRGNADVILVIDSLIYGNFTEVRLCFRHALTTKR